MPKVPTTLSIDAEVKAKVQTLFAELGLDLSTAVTLFFRRCLMENGILIDVPECDVHKFIKYDEFTHVYTNVFGYYMMFRKNTVLAMIRHSDIPEGQKDEFEDTMVTSLNDTCKVSRFF